MKSCRESQIKISVKVDTNYIHKDYNLEEVEIDTYIYKLKQLNPEEENDN